MALRFTALEYKFLLHVLEVATSVTSFNVKITAVKFVSHYYIRFHRPHSLEIFNYLA